MNDVNWRVIEKLKKRDEKAFDVIYDKYYRLVYYVAYEILNDASMAEDILQETFIKLMENIENYVDQGNFKQYLLRIAKNLALNEYNKRKKHEEVSLPEDASYCEEHDDFLLILMLNRTLDEIEATIVKYKVLYDYSFQEIADDMKLTIGKVQSQYYNAMKKLKKYYIEKEGI